jgi:hypothetical protein
VSQRGFILYDVLEKVVLHFFFFSGKGQCVLPSI